MTTPFTSTSGKRRSSVRRAAALGLLAATTIFAQSAGTALDGVDPLAFSKSYTVTGNYVVGGVDLLPMDVPGGYQTGTIPMAGVPANADILAAFLYWETISNNPAEVYDGVKFRGSPITVVKTAKQPLTNDLATCWSSGGGPFTLSMYRADVLRLLPEQLDVDGKTTGRRLVNDTDLQNYGFAKHTVTLPEKGLGNLVPQTAGASLFVVYRHLAEPLTKIVVYEGVHVQPFGVATTQTLRGFLQASANPKAKLTHITGGSAPNETDRLWFTAGARTLLANNPFPASSDASDRTWSNKTYDVSALMGSIGSHPEYGQQVITEIDHRKSTPYDCLSWGAMIFSTTVKHQDRDGLIDLLEDSNSTLKEPTGAPLPNLKAMGATSTVRDLFLEVGAMKALAGTTYGSANAPFSPTQAQATDAAGHDHVPNPNVVKTIGDAFRDAPVTNDLEPTNSPWRTGIRFHADLGPDYDVGPNLPDAKGRKVSDYVVPSGFARGGELITEVACVSEG